MGVLENPLVRQEHSLPHPWNVAAKSQPELGAQCLQLPGVEPCLHDPSGEIKKVAHEPVVPV
jgi:hypothetical protein